MQLSNSSGGGVTVASTASVQGSAPLFRNILLGISILVKMARNGRHQTVSVPMSHTSVPTGRVTEKSSLV